MVEFLRDDTTGEFKLMEINPRFWSSLPFSVQAGADFPYYYWLLATDERERIDDSYEPGVAGHLLRGELLHLHSVLTDDVELVEKPSVPETVGEILWSVVKHPRFDYARLDDLRPFVRDLLNAYGETRAKYRPERSDPEESNPNTEALSEPDETGNPADGSVSVD